MSHNKIKIGSKSPNTSGEITVDLNDLNNVNASSPSDTQLLKYVSASSEWQAVDPSAASPTMEYILIGQGESNDYDNSTTDTTITSSHILGLYDTSPTNNITGASLTNEGSTDWVKSISLPAGKYQIWLSYRVEFSASGFFAFAVFSGSTRISSFACIGESLGIYDGTASVLQNLINLSSTTTITLKPVGVTNVDSVANQGNTPAEYSSLYIEKLS